MRTFRDQQNRAWDINVRVRTIQQVRGECAIDLIRLLTEQSLHQDFAQDVVQQATVLTAVCRQQFENRGMTEEQFQDLLVGEVLEQANDALIRSIIDFFPNRRQAKVMEAAIDSAYQQMNHKLKALEVQLQTQPSSSGESSSSSPASSAATQETGLSASL